MKSGSQEQYAPPQDPQPKLAIDAKKTQISVVNVNDPQKFKYGSSLLPANLGGSKNGFKDSSKQRAD